MHTGVLVSSPPFGQLSSNQPHSQGYSLRNSYAPLPKKYTEQKAWQEAGVQQPLGKYDTKNKRHELSADYCS
jgi:hypothetical protein